MLFLVKLLANERQRDALLDLARCLGVIFEAAIGMAVHVDEAGRDHASRRIDDGLAGFRAETGADLDDGVARDLDVRRATRRACAVDERAALDQQARRSRLRLTRGG